MTNYTQGGGTYRIFYVDTAGTFGEPNTIYLKRDWTGNNVRLDGDASMIIGPSSYSEADLNVMRKMNALWYEHRGSDDSWWGNERGAMRLCAPSGIGFTSTEWNGYYDSSKANYVIGSPSIEMYVASYNDVPHSVGNVVLSLDFWTWGTPYGYILLSDGEKINHGYATKKLDNSARYNYMYMPSVADNVSRYGWIASVGYSDFGDVMSWSNVVAAVSYMDLRTYVGITPVVSLKADFLLELGTS